MAKRSLGIFVLSCGGVVGLVTGGTFGLVIAAACLVAGVLILASSDRGPSQKPRTRGLLLVLVKELHARPIQNGKFHEISDPNETVQFELFARCWLVSKVLSPVNVTALQLRVTRANSSVVEPEPVPEDLQSWRLGKLTEEEDSTGIRRLKTANEEMPPIELAHPLLTGVAREGWLHYRVRNISLSELKAASIELVVTDFTGTLHHGGISGPRVIPGRVWPFAQPPLTHEGSVPNTLNSLDLPAQAN